VGYAVRNLGRRKPGGVPEDPIQVPYQDFPLARAVRVVNFLPLDELRDAFSGPPFDERLLHPAYYEVLLRGDHTDIVGKAKSDPRNKRFQTAFILQHVLAGLPLARSFSQEGLADLSGEAAYQVSQYGKPWPRPPLGKRLLALKKFPTEVRRRVKTPEDVERSKQLLEFLKSQRKALTE
jgi:hypothetical protein